MLQQISSCQLMLSMICSIQFGWKSLDSDNVPSTFRVAFIVVLEHLIIETHFEGPASLF